MTVDQVNDLKSGGERTGQVALWINYGTLAYFRNLTITPASGGVGSTWAPGPLVFELQSLQGARHDQASRNHPCPAAIPRPSQRPAGACDRADPSCRRRVGSGQALSSRVDGRSATRQRDG